GRPSPRSRSNRLPGGGWRRGDDRRPIVAGNRVRQLPRCEPGTGGPASGVAAEVGHLELRARRREVEGAAVVDADGTDVARDDVLERRVPGGTRTQHRRARSVDVDVLEMDVRDGVEILHWEVGNDQDRVVRVLQEVVAANLDVRCERAFERVEPDRSKADLPIELERPGPQGRVVREPEVAGDRGRPEPR